MQRFTAYQHILSSTLLDLRNALYNLFMTFSTIFKIPNNEQLFSFQNGKWYFWWTINIVSFSGIYPVSSFSKGMNDQYWEKRVISKPCTYCLYNIHYVHCELKTGPLALLHTPRNKGLHMHAGDIQLNKHVMCVSIGIYNVQGSYIHE